MLDLTRPSLVVEHLGLTYAGSRGRPVLRDVSFEMFESDRIALLGRNGQGKSTLIKLLGGVLRPSLGHITWRMTSSWPIGFAGGFQGSLTGYDNIRFLSRVYGAEYAATLEKVEDFAELGSALKRPVKQYSSGMRARLAFGLSLAVEFDCYLIDELVAVGDAKFQRKCQDELFQKRRDRSFIIASHDLHLLSNVAEKAIIIDSGEARVYEDVDEAIEIYQWLRA
ncbi:ATP-binding protein [Brevundimonas sp. GN22]